MLEVRHEQQIGAIVLFLQFEQCADTTQHHAHESEVRTACRRCLAAQEQVHRHTSY